jgi:hypothetical protein
VLRRMGQFRVVRSESIANESGQDRLVQAGCRTRHDPEYGAFSPCRHLGVAKREDAIRSPVPALSEFSLGWNSA